MTLPRHDAGLRAQLRAAQRRGLTLEQYQALKAQPKQKHDIGRQSQRLAAERRGMSLEQYLRLKSGRQQLRAEYGPGVYSQIRAAERRGLELAQYLAQVELEEEQREQRREHREQDAAERAEFLAKQAARRRAMLFPGEGQDLGNGMVLLGSFVDTLYVALRGVVREDVMERLRSARASGLEQGGRETTGLLWGGDHVYVHPRGMLFWAMRLETDDWNLLLDGQFGPDLYVQFRAQCLYRDGALTAWLKFRDWLVRNVLDVYNGATVSRLDLAGDVAGLDLSDLNERHFVARVHRKEKRPELEVDKGFDGRIIYYGTRTFTIYVGARSSRIMLRLYDKLAELRVSGKEWMFHYWTGWDGQSIVTRVEVQLRAEFIEEIGTKAPEEVLQVTGDLWREAVGTHDGDRLGWCTYRVPHGQDKDRRRWPVAPWWEQLARLGFTDTRQGLVREAREKQQGTEAKALARAALGYQMEMARRSGYRPAKLDAIEIREALASGSDRIITEALEEMFTDHAGAWRKKLRKAK